jgi:hypothetical protein
MTADEVDKAVAMLFEAIEGDNEQMGREAACALIASGLKNLQRIADALDHIARNIPTDA